MIASLAGSMSLLAMSASIGHAQGIQLDGIVVTFSKTNESAIDALAGSSAVSKTELDQQFQADRASEILRTLPGVTTSETARDTAQSVNIRGLQDFGRVNVLIEGARQNFQRSGHNANGVFYLEPEMLKRVDITRGPTATIYGSGAIGGVVAFELLDADDILRPGEYVAGRMRGRYSSNGQGLFGSATGAMKVGNFDILGQLNDRDVGNYEDGNGRTVSDSGEKTQSGLAKARWRPAAGHQITGSVIDYESEFVDRPTATSTTRRDTDVHNRQYTLGYTYARPDTPLLDYSAKIYRNSTDLEQRRINNSFFEPAGSYRFFQIETMGFDVHNTSRFNFGNVKLALTYGGDAFWDDVATSDRVGNGDELTPGGKRSVSGAFVQSRFSFFDVVDLIGAVRYDQYDLSGGGHQSDGSRVSPKVTLGVTPLRGVTLFATYAEGYRAPAITETLISGLHPQPSPFELLPNPDLKPEVAHNVEGGINLKYDGVFVRNDLFRAKTVVFQNKVDDYIGGVFSPTPLPFGRFQYQNIANATLEGVEFEGMYDARFWFLGVGAARIRGTDDTTGQPLLTVPADQITLTTGFRAFEDRLIAGTRIRLVDAQDRVPTGTAPVDGYTVVDLFGQYELNDAMTINLNVDNVFDRAYIQYLDQSYSPGLNARIGMTIRVGAK
jgi:hemoglobin/transferrin/lactoferrin receptor protein